MILFQILVVLLAAAHATPADPGNEAGGPKARGPEASEVTYTVPFYSITTECTDEGDMLRCTDIAPFLHKEPKIYFIKKTPEQKNTANTITTHSSTNF